MRLSIRHTTRYRFAEPVAHGIQRLRLTPKETQGQRILDWTMEFEGAHEQLSYDDQNFNHVSLVAVDPGTQQVVVSCAGHVDTEDNAGVIGQHAGHLPLWAFLGRTPLTKPGPAIRSIIADVERSEGGMVQTLHNLSAAIRDRVTYGTGVTVVTTTGEEAAAEGQGVCQDHAHIFIAAARMLEIPARYVSGYLMMNDRIDQEATHAWAEAWVQGLGWVGFDISNGISPDPRYVRVATGRDYTDAAPITGISFGAVTEDLTVDVAVEQQMEEQQQQ
ncbi:transglutaminase family protein [Aurantiacibacter gangjinensis]|uniref:Transglutaminase n=1 Tax=Aurantiacibacter gangjinensis TaxID=502682 RepID=A0A0G9MMZ3_9SPHN|nr:transglutaminase family protein [Aurantiacibacter gangjinensis]APE28166.1 Protein containing transglutaminase-like domain, putative cysteine protease [Aurantiacibacter gangjinensis]KLE32075.1 transglutaminase [Aurantiacibacter gangjinensis]